jgi:hypothetical protein
VNNSKSFIEIIKSDKSWHWWLWQLVQTFVILLAVSLSIDHLNDKFFHYDLNKITSIDALCVLVLYKFLKGGF